MPITSSPQEEKKQNIVDWRTMPGKVRLKQRLENHPADSCKLRILSQWLNDIDTKLLSQFLKIYTKIISLYLGANHIGVEGAKALAKNVTLTSLDLWSNNIGDEGAKALAKNVTLTSLNLERNKIGDEVLAEVNRAIDSNKALYLSFISKIEEIKSWSVELLKYFIRYANMKSSVFSDEEDNIYKIAHKTKIDKVANKLVTQGYLGKTEKDLYDAISPIYNDHSLQCMPSSLHAIMNSYIDYDLTREDITHALGEDINESLYDQCCIIS